MADNILTTDRTAANIDIAAKDVSGVLVPRNIITDPSGTDITPLTDTQLRATPVAVSGTFWQATQPVSGTFWQATQPVSAVSLPLPTGAATETTLSTINGKLPSLGQATMANSQPVAIASNQSAIPVTSTPAAALLTSYSQAGVITINTVLTTLDCSQYRGISIQCTSMGTTGVVTPEWPNDNATWVAATILTPAGATATTFNAAGLWDTPVMARYLRLRLSTATTAGTTTLSIHQFDDSRQMWLATQPVSGTVTANIGTGSIAAGTNAIGDVGVQYRANATGAGTVSNVNCPATPAVQTIKASAGRLLAINLTNTAASSRWLKVWNTASGSITLGTTAALFEIGIPAGQRLVFNLEGGAGFSTAINIAITGGQGLTNNTAVTLGDVTGITVHA